MKCNGRIVKAVGRTVTRSFRFHPIRPSVNFPEVAIAEVVFTDHNRTSPSWDTFKSCNRNVGFPVSLRSDPSLALADEGADRLFDFHSTVFADLSGGL